MVATSTASFSLPQADSPPQSSRAATATGASQLAAVFSQLAFSLSQSAFTVSQEPAGAWTAMVATSQLAASLSQLATAGAQSCLASALRRADSRQLPSCWTGAATATVAISQLVSQLSAGLLARLATATLSQDAAGADSQLAAFFESQEGSCSSTATATWATFCSLAVMRSHQPRSEGAWATALAPVSQELLAAVSQSLLATESQALLASESQLAPFWATALAADSEHSDLAVALVSPQPASWAEAWPAKGARRRVRTRSCLMRLSGGRGWSRVPGKC